MSGWFGLAALGISLFLLKEASLSVVLKAVIIIAVMFAVMFSIEAILCLRARSGLIGAPSLRKLDVQRSFLKTLGLCFTILCVAAGYVVFPEYLTPFYQPYYEALRIGWPFLAVFFLICLLWEDTHALADKDDYYFIGLSITRLRVAPLKNVDLKQHFLKWVIKLYFLPLMFVYLTRYLNYAPKPNNPYAVYDAIYNHVFLIDTAFCCVGYIFANTLIDTQIRSAEPTLLGWLCTIVCYQPFWSLIGNQYLTYGSSWGDWLLNFPRLRIIWSTLIVMFLCLYLWATLTFGSRFSNLTHRGVLVCGPYAYLRHPAYIGKLGSFFLMYVPFIGNDWISVIRNILLWALVAGVYVLRAKTEEAHFRSVGPEYDLYTQEVAQNWKNLGFGNVNQRST